MGAEMHAGRVVPDEKRLAFLLHLVDESEGVFGRLLVDRFHALFGERAGVLDLLPAFAVGPAMQHAARSEPLVECRILRIVRILGLLLGIEVIEVAEELVEAMHCGQKFVLIPQMVFAELARGVAERL